MFKKVPQSIITIATFIVAVFLQVVAMNFFFIPNDVFSAGFNGIAQLLSFMATSFFSLNISTGIWILIFNVIIGFFGLKAVNSRFIILSLLNAVVVSTLMIFIPQYKLVNDLLLASLFGGILLGIATGITIRAGFSTGGMDIVAMIVQKRTGRSIGAIINTINFLIVVLSSILIGWERSLFTLIGMYAMGQVIDTIYTAHRKLTVLIVTKKTDEMVSRLQKELIRGITLIPTKGAYKREDSTTIMMVINSVELYDLQHIVSEIDPMAFTDILNTVDVKGLFYTPDQQKQMKNNPPL